MVGITWQTAAKALTAILLVLGVLTYSNVLGVLFDLKGVDYTYTGDMVCGETCESYINVTTSYWRICFADYNDTKYEDKILFKKVASSRTLHVNLGKVDNIIQTEPRIEVDWLVPTYGNNWRPIKDGDCWDRGKVNRIKLVGHKNETVDVKWSFITDEYVDIDPYWYAMTQELISREVTIAYNDSDAYFEEHGEILNETITKYYQHAITGNYEFLVDNSPKCFANDGPSGDRDCELGVQVYNNHGSNVRFNKNAISPMFRSNHFGDFDLIKNGETTKNLVTLDAGLNNFTATFTSPMHVVQEKFNVSIFGFNIDPEISACTIINSPGYYNLTVDLTDITISKCIDINRTLSNVTFDCMGNTIDGNGVADYGIYAYTAPVHYANITIKNCVLTDWDTNVIRIGYAENVTIDNITATGTDDVLNFYYGAYIVINNSELTSGASITDGGIIFSNGVTDVTVENTVIDAGDNAIWMYDSGANIIFKNVTVDSNYENYIWYENTVSNCDTHEWINVTVGTTGHDVVLVNSETHINGGNYGEIMICGDTADGSSVKNITMGEGGISFSGAGIFIIGADNILLDNITFDVTAYAVRVDWTGINITLSNSYSFKPYLGHFFDDTLSDTKLIYNNEFVDTSDTAIHFIDIDSTSDLMDNINITNNTFWDNGGSKFVQVLSTGNNHYVYNNIFNYTGAVAETWHDLSASVFGNYSLPDNFNRILSTGPVGGNYYITGGAGTNSSSCTDSNTDGFCDAVEGRDFQPYSTKFALSDIPRWGDNQTDGTVANTEVLFSVLWNSSDDANSNMSHYIFGWHNGSNWTQASTSADLETGIQNEKAIAGAEVFSEDFETFDTGTDLNPVVTNWTTSYAVDSGCVWWKDTDGTVSSSTGPCGGSNSCITNDAGYDDNEYAFVETSSANCNAGSGHAYLNYSGIDLDTYPEMKIYFAYNMYGANMGNLSLQIDDGVGGWDILWSEQGDQGVNWFIKNISLSDYSGTRNIRFDYDRIGETSYWGDVAIDVLNISQEGSGAGSDANKTAVIYSDVDISPYEAIINLTFIVNVSYYNTTGSVLNSNTNVTLWLEVYNGTGWIDEGDFGVSSSQATGNYSIFTNNASIISGWNTAANRDFKISARYVDYNDSTHYDIINWTAVWVKESSQQKFLNDSAVAFTSNMCTINNNLCWSNISKNITSTSSATVSWYVWANTTTGLNYNTTDTFSFTTTGGAADTCTYTSGDWDIDCSDDCSITSEVNIDATNNITITGTGTFTTTKNITNYNTLTITGTDVSNRCVVVCQAGGCFTN